VADQFSDVVQRNAKPVERAAAWLLEATRDGTDFPSVPIGLYFARLWYHERLYPIIWTLGALKAAREALTKS
jgi:squalene-hopene/tetraprenyl-beta-curcumene cyclase